jgi:hypothetical protein
LATYTEISATRLAMAGFLCSRMTARTALMVYSLCADLKELRRAAYSKR